LVEGNEARGPMGRRRGQVEEAEPEAIEANGEPLFVEANGDVEASKAGADKDDFAAVVDATDAIDAPSGMVRRIRG
jgi:hypothetical protein